MAGAAVGDGVAMMRDAVDVLLGEPFEALPAAELTRLFGELEVQRRRLAAVDQRLIAALGASGAASSLAACSVADLVSQLSRCTRGAARARVARSVDLGPRRAVSGEALEPIHPLTAAAVSDGEVSEAHCGVIVAALGRICPDADPSVFEVAERFLVDAAQHQNPSELAVSARWVLARLDPDGVEPDETTVERTRSFSLSDARDGGGGVLARGRLTHETAAALRTVLDALAAPRPTNEAGERDERSAGQRYHDALLEAALRLLRSDLPESGGVPASVIVHLRPEDVTTDTAPDGEPDVEPAADAVPVPAARGSRRSVRLSGLAELGDGQLLGLNRARYLIDDCEITSVVLDASGGIVDYGRERRTATPAMRRALTARDGGCCFPGCDRPAAWTEAHHVREWLHGGPTSLDNLCLLCSHHHRALGPAGWTVIMRDGVPIWIPPAWLDPDRKPIRNTARHLPTIDFGRIDSVLRT